MGSELIQMLEQEAKAEHAKILTEAKTQADATLAAARREAEEILATGRRSLEVERNQARTRAASAASLKASALVLESKDREIQTAFERAEQELKRASADPARRKALLHNLIAEAAQGVASEGAVLEVPPGEAQVAKDVSAQLGLSLEVRESPDVSGGIRLTTGDRRVTVENTVESRLERTRSTLVSRVAEILWGA